MIDGASTMEKVAAPPATPTRTGAWKRFAIIAVGLGLVAAIATSTAMVLGGNEAYPTVGPVVTGDRDAAWLSSLERQAAYENGAPRDKEEALRQAEERRAAQATDKEEALRQAEERRAAQATDKEEALRQAEERRAALNR